MKTIKEITAALKEAKNYMDWMEPLKLDERAAVHKALIQFEKRMEKQRKIQQSHNDKLVFDGSFLQSPSDLIAGVDEAGRGPLAGPVVTAAVILPNNCQELLGINDSKQLSKEQRNNFAERIKQYAISYTIHFQPVEAIDRYNILEATRQSMTQCIENLEVTPHVVIADAMVLPVQMEQHSIIKGDAKSLCIAAASILAKTARDEYMEQLAQVYPQYGFEQHAGYGTKQHLQAIETYGVTPEHRTSFEPIKSIVKG